MTSSRPPFLITLSIKRDWVRKVLKVLNFLKAFLSSSFRICYFKINACMQWQFWVIYLAKLKRGLRLPFGECFLYDFSIKMFLNSLSMDKVSMSHLISFSNYQTKCIIKFLFRQLMTS